MVSMYIFMHSSISNFMQQKTFWKQSISRVVNYKKCVYLNKHAFTALIQYCPLSIYHTKYTSEVVESRFLWHGGAGPWAPPPKALPVPGAAGEAPLVCSAAPLRRTCEPTWRWLRPPPSSPFHIVAGFFCRRIHTGILQNYQNTCKI